MFEIFNYSIKLAAKVYVCGDLGYWITAVCTPCRQPLPYLQEGRLYYPHS